MSMGTAVRPSTVFAGGARSKFVALIARERPRLSVQARPLSSVSSAAPASRAAARPAAPAAAALPLYFRGHQVGITAKRRRHRFVAGSLDRCDVLQARHRFDEVLGVSAERDVLPDFWMQQRSRSLV